MPNAPLTGHPPPAAALRLRLRGDPALLPADGLARPLERRAAALLALVAFEPGISRARVAALLWPDSDDARRALRQQLMRFRTAFGFEVVQGAEALQLGGGLVADVAAEAGAVAGELLAGFEYDDCDAFAAWLGARRAHDRAARTAALQAQVAVAEAQGDLAAACALASQLIALEGEHEAHFRTLMRLHYLAGDIARAHGVYEDLGAMLERRFGARPSAETEALAQALRAAAPGPAVAAAAPAPLARVPVSVLRPPRLIGRQRELAALAAAWQEGRAVLLQGEPGLGKTRLLAEFAGGRCGVSVQGRPGDGGVPYATLARLLRGLFQRAQLDLAAPSRTELARLLPELAPELPLPAEGQRLLVQGAVEAVLAQARVDGAPLAGVLVDDLHFADAASVEMLHALMASDGLPDLRWVLAQRPGEGTAAGTALHTALTEAGIVVVLELEPLGVDEMAALIDSLGVPELDSARLAQPLVRHTGGNPLYALETLKQGLASGSLRDGTLPVPVQVGALIERRLRQLPARALSLARVAAIAGVDFSIALAERVIGLRAVELADAWAELEGAQVLRGDAFAHDLVADAVLRTVPAPIARHLHAAVAEFIAPLAAEPARVALHWHAAGLDALAGPAFLAAARRAQGALRLAEAVTLAGQGLALAGWTDADGRFEAAALAVAALLDLDLGERMSAALDVLDGCAATPVQRATTALYRAQVALYGNRADEAAQAARAGATLAAAGAAQAEYLQLRTVEARALALQGAGDAAIALLRADLPAAAAAGASIACEFHGILGRLLQVAARIPEARLELQLALELARALDRRADVVNLLNNLAICDQLVGRAAAAAPRLEEAARLGQSLDLAGVGGQFLSMNRVATLLELNRYREAIALAAEAEADLRRDAPAFLPLIANLRARTWIELGQPARAEREFSALPADAGTPRYVLSYRAQLRARAARALGRDPHASLEQALQFADDGGRLFVHWEARLLAAACGAQALAGDLDELLQQVRARGFAAHEAAALALLAARDPAAPQAAPLALRALALLADGVAPRWMYRGTVYRACVEGLQADGAAARAAAQTAVQWLRGCTDAAVPDAFRDSFVHRNADNALLLRAARG